MAKIKADLHMHGPIGFQKRWLELQGYNKPGTNLLKLIADTCFERGIDLCAITSEEFEIPKGSVHDRFDYLVKEARYLPKEYEHDKKADILLSVEKQGRLVYIINGQTVIAYDGKRRVDHLVVGSNQVPNKRHLGETI